VFKDSSRTKIVAKTTGLGLGLYGLAIDIKASVINALRLRVINL